MSNQPTIRPHGPDSPIGTAADLGLRRGDVFRQRRRGDYCEWRTLVWRDEYESWPQIECQLLRPVELDQPQPAPERTDRRARRRSREPVRGKGGGDATATRPAGKAADGELPEAERRDLERRRDALLFKNPVATERHWVGANGEHCLYFHFLNIAQGNAGPTYHHALRAALAAHEQEASK